ncbi:hypothetical protein IGS68_34925 (plasmid) [Skermanella sp. TT6]|uniref:Uncharacterized protein n=1 Tax=Skermanella cutis TaxID=2775420 RepID=A0ABX7BHX2_9PROT|nr:hypothetical protein [Skermanella sp. TT6]QQP93974.1 hypothetical protein IGS68_34925 [Skermanella sp. TT6]
MHPTLAARRLDVLRVRLEKDKATVLGGLDQIEELAQWLQGQTEQDLCLALGPVIEALRREIDTLDVRSPGSAGRLKNLAARLDDVSQVIVSQVRALATS